MYTHTVVPDETAAASEWVVKEEHLTTLLNYIQDFSHKWYYIPWYGTGIY